MQSLTLQTSDSAVTANDILGRIAFAASNETGTDAIKVSALIQAVANGTFDATNNPTALVLCTAKSETATERMRIDEDGNVGIGTTYLSNGKFTVVDGVNTRVCIDTGGNIGSSEIGIDFVDRHNATSQGDEGQVGAFVRSQRQGSGGSYDLILGTADNSNLAADADEKVRITSEGYLGVKNNAPTTELHVSGVITATGGSSTEWNAGYLLAIQAYAWGDHSQAGYFSTDEQIEDIVGSMVSGNTETGITVTYQDNGTGNGKLDFVVATQSDNNFTTTLLNKLNNIDDNATANDTDANLKNRSNHTGTQTASTISDFDTQVASNSAVSSNTAKVSNATHTGDVTGATLLTIADDVVTYAKIQNVVSNNVLLGNDNGAGSAVQELSASDVRTLINVENNADATNSTNVDAAGAVMNTDTSTASMDFVIDEDDMASDSNSKIPTQQSVKAYVDNNAGGGAGNLIRGSFVVTTSTSVFTVSGGYNANTLDVYQNGVKLFKGSLYDYQETSGNTEFTLTNAATNGDLIEYVALNASTSATGNTSLSTVSVTSNQTDFSTTDSISSTQLVVFLNGIKLVEGTSASNADYEIVSSNLFRLHSTAVSGDVVEYIIYGATVASSNLAKTGDTMTGNLTVNADLIVTGYKETHTDNGNTGTAQTIDISDSTLQTYTLTGNCTFTMPTADAGRSFTMFLKTGAGSFVVTFTNVKFPQNSAPTITTDASRMDIITFYSDGTNWYGSIQQEYHV